jgi:hypothetical protein
MAEQHTPVLTCPHCGGRNGFTRIQHRTVTRLFYWDGNAEDLNDEQVTRELGAHCFDCNKPLTRAAIAKATGGSHG